MVGPIQSIFYQTFNYEKIMHPEGFDSFLWFRIASFITAYPDLHSLSLTCCDLWCVCKPLKKKFPEHYVRRVNLMLSKERSKLSKLWRLTSLPTPAILSEPSVLSKLIFQFKTHKEWCSDIYFRTMLYQSEKKALLTFIPRGIDSPDLQCFEFKLILNSDRRVKFSKGDQKYPDFWFRNLHQSILSFAFNQDGRFREDILLHWLEKSDFKRMKARCWLWFERQTVPQESVLITTISHMGYVQKFFVHNDKVYSTSTMPRFVPFIIGTLILPLLSSSVILNHCVKAILKN